jgi:hypothetical protein
MDTQTVEIIGRACAYALRYDEAKRVADEVGWTEAGTARNLSL